MTPQQIIRAWKDETYRDALDLSERKQLPNHPAGLIELAEVDLAEIAAAFRQTGCISCTEFIGTCLPGFPKEV